jgi:hypothetical protein
MPCKPLRASDPTRRRDFGQAAGRDATPGGALRPVLSLRPRRARWVAHIGPTCSRRCVTVRPSEVRVCANTSDMSEAGAHTSRRRPIAAAGPGWRARGRRRGRGAAPPRTPAAAPAAAVPAARASRPRPTSATRAGLTPARRACSASLRNAWTAASCSRSHRATRRRSRGRTAAGSRCRSATRTRPPRSPRAEPFGPRRAGRPTTGGNVNAARKPMAAGRREFEPDPRGPEGGAGDAYPPCSGSR